MAFDNGSAVDDHARREDILSSLFGGEDEIKYIDHEQEGNETREIIMKMQEKVE